MNNRIPRILIVDNFDSFTFNIVQIVQEHGVCDFDVYKNNSINIDAAAKYDGFLFSPGPGIPDESPVMAELLRKYYNKRSFLGICLGHQAIAETFGMKLIKLDNVRHGYRTSVRITDLSDYIFKNVPGEFQAGHYHSWAAVFDNKYQEKKSDLHATAMSSDGIVMAIAHLRYNIRGVQFHPESYMTEYGDKVIHNWISNILSEGK